MNEYFKIEMQGLITYVFSVCLDNCKNLVFIYRYSVLMFPISGQLNFHYLILVT